MNTQRIPASLDVWLQSDIERILHGIFAANEPMLRIHRDAETTAFAAGYLAALRAVAISFGVESFRESEKREIVNR